MSSAYELEGETKSGKCEVIPCEDVFLGIWKKNSMARYCDRSVELPAILETRLIKKNKKKNRKDASKSDDTENTYANKVSRVFIIFTSLIHWWK